MALKHIRAKNGESSCADWANAVIVETASSLEFDTPCEGHLHATGMDGHEFDQPAAYALSFGCPSCHQETIHENLCDGRVTYLFHKAPHVICENCSATAEFIAWVRVITPLTPELRH